jgi:hypothetical protein
MTIGLLLGLLLAIATIAFIAYPLFTGKGLFSTNRGAEADRLADLLARRDGVLRAIADLDFDFQVGKLAESDYRPLRAKYMAQGVAILQELDALGASGVSECEADKRMGCVK